MANINPTGYENIGGMRVTKKATSQAKIDRIIEKKKRTKDARRLARIKNN